MFSHAEFEALVGSGIYPTQVPVPLPAPFENAAGAIQNLALSPLTSVALIKSRKGAVRANHYHRTDWHYAYVLRGRVIYFWRDVGSGRVPFFQTFGAGEMFFTPPMKEHAMYFMEEGELLTFARNRRDHESHEADVVRVPVIEVTGESPIFRFPGTSPGTDQTPDPACHPCQCQPCTCEAKP